MASIIYLTFTLYNTLNSIVENSPVNFTTVFNKFISDVRSFESLEEINEMFVDLFNEIIDVLETMNSQKTDTVINSIIAYIDRNYHDKNLCLNSVADAISLSPTYVRRLFKEATGK
mgnify:CR=1 FL=1